MAQIKPNQDFKHGQYIYSKGVEYEVSEEDADYFESAGWVGEQPGIEQEHFLEVHDVMLGHSSEVN